MFGNNIKKLNPIVPINLFESAFDKIPKAKISSEKANLNLDAILNYFDNRIQNYVDATPNKFDDFFYKLFKSVLQKVIPEPVKIIFDKVVKFLSKIIAFIDEVIDFIKTQGTQLLAVINAFLCGIINGFIELLQLVLWLLAFIVDNLPIFETKDEYRKDDGFEEKLELIEDFIDIINLRFDEVFSKIKETLEKEGFWALIQQIASAIGKLSKYTVAFILGAIVFEVIVELILAFFTGGVANVATKFAQMGNRVKKVGNYAVKGINASQKFLKNPQKVAKNGFKNIDNYAKSKGKKIASNAHELILWLNRAIDELLQGLDNFGDYIVKKIVAFFNIAEDAITSLKVELFVYSQKTSKGGGILFSAEPISAILISATQLGNLLGKNLAKRIAGIKNVHLAEITQGFTFAYKGTVIKQFEDASKLKAYLKNLFKKTDGDIVKHLDILEKVKLRKAAYSNFIKQIAKKDLDDLLEHIFEGHFGRGGRRGRFLSAKGVHSHEAIINGHIRYIGRTIPDPPIIDELYTAFIEKKYTHGQWIKKINHSGQLQPTTFFPKNWDKQRIIEEIAYAWQNKVSSTNPNMFLGLTTSGNNIKFYINNGKIATAFPIN